MKADARLTFTAIDGDRVLVKVKYNTEDDCLDPSNPAHRLCYKLDKFMLDILENEDDAE